MNCVPRSCGTKDLPLERELSALLSGRGLFLVLFDVEGGVGCCPVSNKSRSPCPPSTACSRSTAGLPLCWSVEAASAPPTSPLPLRPVAARLSASVPNPSSPDLSRGLANDTALRGERGVRGVGTVRGLRGDGVAAVPSLLVAPVWRGRRRRGVDGAWGENVTPSRGDDRGDAAV